MKRIALIGMPNTGKSTFFNRLTGSSARTGNWPGITVELASAKILLGADMVEVVDLPGIYNLHGFSEDETVVREFLARMEVNMLVVVLNSAQADHQLSLALQVKRLGLPMVLLLNMSDEAKHLGVQIDTDALSEELGFPAVCVSAKHGSGFGRTKSLLESELRGHEEARLAQTAGLEEDKKIEEELDRIVSNTVLTPITLPEGVSDKIDRVVLHPWLGLPLFLFLVYLMFEVVYRVGTPLQDAMGWLLDLFKENAVVPMIASWPAPVQSFLVDGVLDGVGTVLTFLPIIVVFFVVMAIVEDSGYLSRAAFLMDALMARLGLDGRSFVLQLMGFGCNVPALMGTRVMRSRSARLLSMLIIPFSLCTARLQVFLLFAAALFAAGTAPLVVFSLYLISFMTAFFTAWLWSFRYRADDPMIMELPPYRFPTMRQLVMQSYLASRQFLVGASGFIVLGVILVWFLTHVPFSAEPASPETLAGQLSQYLAIVFEPIGVEPILSVALLFGFVAKEVVVGGLAVIYSTAEDNLASTLASQLDWVQAYSFMLFTLIYTPCLSTVAVIQRESKSIGFTTLAVLWPLFLAWFVSFFFYQLARALGY